VAARRAWLAALALAAACGGDGEPASRLLDGTHTGMITALEPDDRVLVFDPVEIVDGEVENPDRAAHRLTMSTEITVRLLKPCCDLHEHLFEDWLAEFEPDDRTFYGTAASRYEVTIDAGEVVLVEEVRLEG
jgi:hypothetical protein